MDNRNKAARNLAVVLMSSKAEAEAKAQKGEKPVSFQQAVQKVIKKKRSKKLAATRGIKNKLSESKNPEPRSSPTSAPKPAPRSRTAEPVPASRTAEPVPASRPAINDAAFVEQFKLEAKNTRTLQERLKALPKSGLTKKQKQQHALKLRNQDKRRDAAKEFKNKQPAKRKLLEQQTSGDDEVDSMLKDFKSVYSLPSGKVTTLKHEYAEVGPVSKGPHRNGPQRKGARKGRKRKETEGRKRKGSKKGKKNRKKRTKRK
jgi:hypothetical protein